MRIKGNHINSRSRNLVFCAVRHPLDFVAGGKADNEGQFNLVAMAGSHDPEAAQFDQPGETGGRAGDGRGHWRRGGGARGQTGGRLNLNLVIGDKRAAGFDQTQGKVGLARSGGADDENALSVELHDGGMVAFRRRHDVMTKNPVVTCIAGRYPAARLFRKRAAIAVAGAG